MHPIKNRIAILDGFRAIAILLVMLFHFFSAYFPPRQPISLYPYGTKYNYFGNGNTGVQFFFIISGFVIFFTLENTARFTDFWTKRLIRLLPSMVFASFITFIFCNLVDKSLLFPESHWPLNFLPSLTFISPDLINHFLASSGIRFSYISQCYWSLWPEIQFYLLSSLLYYINKDKFIRNFVFIAGALIFTNYIIANITGANPFHIAVPEKLTSFYKIWFQKIFNLFTYLQFFSIGVLFYLLFKNKLQQIKTPVYIKLALLFFMLFMIYSGVQNNVRLIYAVYLLLFYLFIYYPKKVTIFKHIFFTSIGESSYFLYLIHECIGVLLIYLFAKYFAPLEFVFTLIVITLMVLLSKLYNDKIDKKITPFLRKILLKNKA